MVVTYFGDGCFRLQSGETSCLIDPINNRLKADVVLRTATSAKEPSLLEGEIAFPGEFEAKNLEIQGIPLAVEGEHNTIRTAYAMEWEGVRFAIFGRLEKIPDPELLEKIGEPEVILLPLDGAPSISAEQAAKIIRELEPNIVITSGAKVQKEMKKVFGQNGEAQEKFVFKKKDLAGEKAKVIVLEGSSA